MAIRIMTYNVHRCVGRDGVMNIERIAKVIEYYRPDIVALQELDVNIKRTSHMDQPHMIAQYLNMHYHFYSSMQVEEGDYGNAILSCFPMHLVKSEKLPGCFVADQWNLIEKILSPAFETRGALWVSLEMENKQVQIINTHLGLTENDRFLQVDQLLSDQWLGHAECMDPVIFLGDLNDSHRSAIFKQITSGFKDLQTELKQKRLNTFLSHIPFRCIDHIFVRGNIEVKDIQVPKTKLTKAASDHLPLIADIEL